MRIDTGQHLRIDQRMKLAPRMIQSMEILQMPMQALEARIEQELTSNPTIELQESGDEPERLEEERRQEERDDREGERELVVGEDGQAADRASDDFERLDNFAEEYGKTWDTSPYETGDSVYRRRAAPSNGERDPKLDALSNTAARSASLYDQLSAQWHLGEADARLMAAGEFLIGFIDADGYIRVDEETLRKQLPPGLTWDEVEKAWPILQRTLEPAGLAARDLRECLLLQIEAKEAQTADQGLQTAHLLVQDHLKDVEANRLPKIARAMGISIDEVKEAILSLRQFHPHPGRLLTDDSPRTIHPDAVVEYDDENDVYVARLTHGRLPAIHISPAYSDMARDRGVDKRTRDFVGHNLRSAQWLIDAIRQRHATLLRVIHVVLNAQREFFEQGPQALRPLPMTQVADQLGIHVATVSRAVNEKYLQTPRGIFPLRMFFSGGTETGSGEAMSWQAVQAKLEEIIESEDKSEPMSDDALADELKKHGIDIARRTVAKYRKQLNIPPARQRKEY